MFKENETLEIFKKHDEGTDYILLETKDEFNDEELEMFETMRFHATAISTFSIITTLVGNSLLIYFLTYKKCSKKKIKLRSHHTIMIHMCVSNLCYALFSILPTLLFSLHLNDFYLPQCICKLYKYLSIIPMYASPFLLVATSVDRYYAICKPLERLNYKFYTTAKFFAFSAWLLSFICSIPNFIIWEETSIGSCDVPPHNAWLSKINILFFSTVAWILPCILVAVLYYYVYCAAYPSKIGGSKSSTIGVSQKVNSFIRIVNGTSSKKTIFNFFKKNSKKESYVIAHIFKGSRKIESDDIAEKKKETVKLTITIVIVSFLMYSPFAIVNLMDFFNVTFGDGRLLTYILFLGNLNSCSSPIIYFYSHTKRVNTIDNSSIIPLTFDF
uniref:G_PROTEIN_RECEP_F1_2 domain-containing protein n=1 Tax=Parastrongyloides trichosuri TaxID=131310 RepID=A0A0N5A4R5_PARTI